MRAMEYLQSSKQIKKMFGFEFWAYIQDGSDFIEMGWPISMFIRITTLMKA